MGGGLVNEAALYALILVGQAVVGEGGGEQPLAGQGEGNAGGGR